MDKQIITEEMHLEKEWFKEAAEMKLEGLHAFIDKMMNGYVHDYGTACHAVAACAVAACWAACDKEGLTGFQAGFVMWDFIKNWTKQYNKTGMKLVGYDDMLYPQYEEKYEKTISQRTWNKLQEEAKNRLEKEKCACGEVMRHWQSIVDGHVPFGYTVKDD